MSLGTLADLRRLAAMALLGVLVAIRIWDPAPLTVLRLKTFDLFQEAKPRPVVQRPVMIVDVDDTSLSKVGQWPWPRDVLARLVGRLAEAGAAVVAFDVVFAEPDRHSPDVFAHGLNPESPVVPLLRAMPNTDRQFAAAMEGVPVVLGMAATAKATATARPHLKKSFGVRRVPPPKPLRDLLGLSSSGGKARSGKLPPLADLVAPHLVHVDGLTRNLPVLEAAAAGHGLFSLPETVGGTIRRVPAVMLHDGRQLYASLFAEVLRVAARRPLLMVEVYDSDPGDDRPSDGVASLVVNRDLKIQTDSEGYVWPYFSRHDPAKYIPAADVLDGAVGKDRLENRVVLVGTSAPGLVDIRTIPTEQAIPGVEIQAQLIETTLFGTYLRRPADLVGAEYVYLVLGGMLMIVAVPMIGARWTLLALVVATLSSAVLEWYLFTEHLMLLDTVYASIAVFLIYTLMTYWGYAAEEARRQRVRDAFAHYLSPAMVDRLADDASRLRLGGERRDLSVLFCDVRGFTSLSERYDAETLTFILNQLLTPLTEAILETGGTVDKYIGDCVMAFWNAPVDDPEHGRSACRAALAMNRKLSGFNESMAQELDRRGHGFDPLRIGIGINSGDAVVGNLGSHQRFDYSVLGDTVNLASRLESQCKTYGVPVILGEYTAAMVPDFALLELDLIQVKGRVEAARIYALLGDRDVASQQTFRALRSQHDGLLTAYRDQDWDEAFRRLDQCREHFGDADIDVYYDLIERRVAQFRTAPPPRDWNGVYIAETK